MAASDREGPGGTRERAEATAGERSRLQAPQSEEGLLPVLRAARTQLHLPGLPGPPRHSALRRRAARGLQLLNPNPLT